MEARSKSRLGDVGETHSMSDSDTVIDALVCAGRRLAGAIGVYRAENGRRHAIIHSSSEAIEARQAMVEAIDVADAARR